MAMFGQGSLWLQVQSGAAIDLYGTIIQFIGSTGKATEWANISMNSAANRFMGLDVRSLSTSIITPDALSFAQIVGGSDNLSNGVASIPLQLGVGVDVSFRVRDNSSGTHQHRAHVSITDVPLFRGILSRSQSSGILDRVAGTAPVSGIADVFGAWKTLIPSLDFDVKWLSMVMLVEEGSQDPECIFELGTGGGPTAIIPGGYSKIAVTDGRDTFSHYGYPIGKGSFLAGESVSIRVKDQLATNFSYNCGITVNGE